MNFFLFQILTEKLVPKLSASNSKPRVIIVSSGGMLTNKMDFQDLNFEKMAPFDGTMAYAQNKLQQVKDTKIVYPSLKVLKKYLLGGHDGTVRYKVQF